MSSKQRLELTWIGKENRPRLEPRILIEDTERSYHAKQRVTEDDIFDNRLIFGDNLLALKALEQEFAGKVKCVFIDPPYNTGSAFAHYDDGVEHSIWLSLIRDRLEILRRLLSEDGSIWITIDDNEAHYLKVLCDEIFGRANFIHNVVWEKCLHRRTLLSTSLRTMTISCSTRRRKSVGSATCCPEAKKANRIIRIPTAILADPGFQWRYPQETSTAWEVGLRSVQAARTIDGPPKGRYWTVSPTKFAELCDDDRITWGKGGAGIPRRKVFLAEVQSGMVPPTIWSHGQVGNTQEAKKEINALLSADTETFGTPKPEKLLLQILHISTRPRDLVLDSFAGSGTTGAVAHKLGRRWIMVELGEHIHTHILPRLQKVIDGEDPGGITETAEWKGGGGFRYFHIAPSLLEKDRFGNLIISKQYNAALLAEAMCKVMGFTFAPSDELYWQQGHSTENDFIYITTQTLTREQLAKLSDEVGENRSLLICCAAFRGKADAFPNLTVKKIPSAVLTKCEWGHDDYSLNVANLPKAAPHVEVAPAHSDRIFTPKQARRRAAQPNLFGTDGNGGAE